MKTYFLIFVSCSIISISMADYYRDDARYPPSGECKPDKSYEGYQRIYHYDQGVQVDDVKTGRSWTVSAGSTVAWSLREIRSPKKDPDTNKVLVVPKASGTMKGKETKTDKTERLIKVILKSINFKMSFF